jgi:hypothetical protein
MTTVLFVGLGGVIGTAAASDYDGQTPAPKGLLTGLFAGKSKAQVKNANKPVEDKPQPPATVDTTDLQRQKHTNAFTRRLAVCDRLRRVALDTGNEALMNQADWLESRAQEIFRQQTAGLPASTPSAVNKPVVRRKDTGVTGESRDKEIDEGSSLPPRSSNAGSLNDSMDRRERAILNGSSMEGDKP